MMAIPKLQWIQFLITRGGWIFKKKKKNKLADIFSHSVGCLPLLIFGDTWGVNYGNFVISYSPII